MIRICQSNKEKFSYGKELAGFCATYEIGRLYRSSAFFSVDDKNHIREHLLLNEGIDVDTAMPDMWNTASRAEMSAIAGNEKLTSRAVRDERVAIKATPGCPILLGPEKIILPPGANLDIGKRHLIEHLCHDSIIVVENWESFDLLHLTTFEFRDVGNYPLVIFRGSPEYRQDHVFDVLRAASLPVFAFVDFDPAGLVIAHSLPNFTGLITPPDLERHLGKGINHKRYMDQLPGAQNTLDRATHRDIKDAWGKIRRAGSALQQEFFIGMASK